MKTLYFKTFFTTLVVLLAVLFYQPSTAATAVARFQTSQAGRADTSRIQKPGKLKRPKKLKADADDQEDGVSDDIRARAHQEFMQQRDPKLNRVPLERMINARTKRDLFLNNVKIRTKNAIQQGAVKPSANQLIAPPGAPPVAPPTISGLQWQERGPNNVGGRTRALIFDAADSLNGYKRVFAGGVGGGLWVTSDITATPVQWTKINDFFDNIAISCIAQNPVNPKEIYAGTGEGFLNADAIQGLGVWKSSDGGATWTHLTSTVGFKYINAILVDRNSNVYVAGESDIFVGFGVDQSTDGGSTWTNVISATEAGADLQMAANGDVYASTGVISLNGHIFISDFAVNGAHTGNAGTWTNITPETTGVITPGTTSWNRIKLAMAPSDANIVYAFFEVDYYSSGGKTNLAAVQQYNKSANTWTVETVPTEAFGNGQAWYSIAAAIDPNNPSVLYAGSLDAEKSTDGGATWTQYTQWNANTTASNYVHADHHAYVYFPKSSTRLLMGTDGGLFYTVNADVTPSFVNKNNGYDVTQFYSVALHPTNFNYALAGAQDNGSEKFSSAGVGPTTVATGGDGADVFIDQTNGNIQITSYVFDQYYVSTDNGTTFNGLGSYGYGQFINPTDYDASTKSIYAGSLSGYYFRVENILSPAYDVVSVSGFNGANVTAVTVAPKTANRIYFGLDNGDVVLVDNAQTGTALAGVVFTPNGGSTPATVSCVNVDPTSENHILVTYSNYGVTHIIETKNASAATPTWTDVSGNLPDMPVRWSLFYPGDPTKAVIATELGVWTTDLINGSSTVWDPSNTGLANVEVDMLKYRAADQTIAAATHGRGVFTTTLKSHDAALANLTISSGTLAPAFAGNVTTYADTVANATTSVTVTPTTHDGTATVKVNGTAVTSGTASGAIHLAAGQNTITTTVTAQDGTTTQTYTIAVFRRLSSVDNLSALTISSGTLAPAFAGGTINYTDKVANSVTSITVTPTTATTTASIKVNGTFVASGSASAAIPLVVGSNSIKVVVTAQDGVTKKTYTITVTRPLSNDAYLSNLKVTTATLSPSFAFKTLSYTSTVPNSTTSVTVTPSLVDVTASSIKVNGTIVANKTASGPIALNIGSNTINVVVTAQDGVTKQTYTVTITRPSSDASLSALKLSSGTLSPVFATGTTSYSASVSSATSSITVTPTTTNANASIKVNGTTVASGTASGAIALNTGTNTISVVVTAQDGTTMETYSIMVGRGSNNAYLSNLKVTTATLSPGFAFKTFAYTSTVPNSTSSVTVTPSLLDATASSLNVNGIAVANKTASTPFALAVGPNNINVVVIAQDGITTQTYTITIYRLSANANLAALKLSSGTLSPAFAPATTGYTAGVTNATDSLKVTPTTSDVNATVKVNGTVVTSGAASSALPLAVGPNTITTVVTAQDGTTTKSYTVTVTRAPSNNAYLSNLKVTTATLSPTFAFKSFAYTANVPNATSSITVTPSLLDATATVMINGTSVANKTASGAIALAVGSNKITAVATAQDGSTTQTYTITITRASGGADSFDPGLSVNDPANHPSYADDLIAVRQGISPNGDGINDFLVIDGILAYPNNRLAIMNREGQLIYEAQGYDNSSKVFDGHSNKNGQMQLPGTYFYQLDYTVNGVTKHKTGFIVLKY